MELEKKSINHKDFIKKFDETFEVYQSLSNTNEYIITDKKLCNSLFIFHVYKDNYFKGCWLVEDKKECSLLDWSEENGYNLPYNGYLIGNYLLIHFDILNTIPNGKLIIKPSKEFKQGVELWIQEDKNDDE